MNLKGMDKMTIDNPKCAWRGEDGSNLAFLHNIESPIRDLETNREAKRLTERAKEEAVEKAKRDRLRPWKP